MTFFCEPCEAFSNGKDLKPATGYYRSRSLRVYVAVCDECVKKILVGVTQPGDVIFVTEDEYLVSTIMES